MSNPSPSNCSSTSAPTPTSQTSNNLKEMEDTISITLLFSKISRQVICVEANKDFVDLLVGFLTLPIGCIVRLLSEASLLGKSSSDLQGVVVGDKNISEKSNKERDREKKVMTSMANVCESIARLEEQRMCTDKSCLLDPRPSGLLGGRLLSHKPPSRDDPGESSHSGFYGCGQTCHYVTTRYGFKCPKHKKLMETQYKIVDEEGNLRSQASNLGPGVGLKKGFVKGGTQYMITNTLEIFASSAIKSLMHLNMIKSERFGDLETKEIQCGQEEMLHLLKASISSNNVLYEVFGKYCAKKSPANERVEPSRFGGKPSGLQILSGYFSDRPSPAPPSPITKVAHLRPLNGNMGGSSQRPWSCGGRVLYGGYSSKS